MRIVVDRDACVGAGQCALAAEEVFDQDDDGIVEVLVAEPEPSAEASVRRAASLCPAGAIALVDGP